MMQESHLPYTKNINKGDIVRMKPETIKMHLYGKEKVNKGTTDYYMLFRLKQYLYEKVIKIDSTDYEMLVLLNLNNEDITRYTVEVNTSQNRGL